MRVTDKVQQLVKKTTIKEGMALISAMHITAGVFVNDTESGLFDEAERRKIHEPMTVSTRRR